MLVTHGVLSSLYRHVPLHLQDKDRKTVDQQSSEVPTGAGDEDGTVELTSIRSLSTGDSMDNMTSDLQASSSSLPASPAGGEPKPSLDSRPSSDKSPDGVAANGIGGEGERDGEGGGERVQSAKKEDEREREKRERPKRETQESTKGVLQRPESLEIDDELAPNLSRMRKSNLRKSRPTPVNTGPTYTVTSPVGEPYDSSGKRRTSTGQECCCIM